MISLGQGHTAQRHTNRENALARVHAPHTNLGPHLPLEPSQGKSMTWLPIQTPHKHYGHATLSGWISEKNNRCSAGNTHSLSEKDSKKWLKNVINQ